MRIEEIEYHGGGVIVSGGGVTLDLDPVDVLKLCAFAKEHLIPKPQTEMFRHNMQFVPEPGRSEILDWRVEWQERYTSLFGTPATELQQSIKNDELPN